MGNQRRQRIWQRITPHGTVGITQSGHPWVTYEVVGGVDAVQWTLEELTKDYPVFPWDGRVVSIKTTKETLDGEPIETTGVFERWYTCD